MKSGKLFLLLGMLLALLASGCSNATPTPAPKTPATGRHDLDMKPRVRDLFAGMPDDWNLVSSQDVAKNKPFIVDVRSSTEYSQGFIAGAVNIPLEGLVQNLSALPAMDKDLVLVDSSGHRSTIGMIVLQILGYKKAKSMTGGMAAWQSAQLAVVTSPVPNRPAGPAPKVDIDVQATLDFYLDQARQVNWGRMNATELTADRLLKSSNEMEAQPETYDQGPSVLIDIDGPEDFSKLNQPKAVNMPLRDMPTQLDTMPLQDTVNWA